MDSQEERCKKVNELLVEISKHDRNFFFNIEDKNVSRFFIKKEEIFYEDEYKKTSKKINLKSEWHSLTWVNHGSTLTSFIFDLANFISNGEKIIIFSEHWGYKYESLKIIHGKAKELRIVKTLKKLDSFEQKRVTEAKNE